MHYLIDDSQTPSPETKLPQLKLTRTIQHNAKDLADATRDVRHCNNGKVEMDLVQKSLYNKLFLAASCPAAFHVSLIQGARNQAVVPLGMTLSQFLYDLSTELKASDANLTIDNLRDEGPITVICDQYPLNQSIEHDYARVRLVSYWVKPKK